MLGSQDGRILQMDAAKLRMRMEKRRNTKPKNLVEIFRPLATAQFTPVPVEYSREMPMQARSVRFRGRTLVVGRTPFIFNKDGICEHEPVGNSLADFNTLLTYHGVEIVVPVVETASTIGPDDPTVPFANVPKVGEPGPPPGNALKVTAELQDAVAFSEGDTSRVEHQVVEVSASQGQLPEEEHTDQTSTEGVAGEQPAQPLPKFGRRRRAAKED